MRIRGVHQDYYVDVEEVAGAKVYLRDLDEDQFAEFMRRTQSLRRLLKLDADVPFTLEGFVQHITQLHLSFEEELELRRAVYGLVSWLLEQGVASWDVCDDEGKPVPVTPQTLAGLPTSLKSRLAQRIIELSQLTLGEAQFPGTAGAGAG